MKPAQWRACHINCLLPAAQILSILELADCSRVYLGAREVIAMIENRRSVTKLILGHNDLGDDGCIELFHYLCSDDGRRYKIAEISLNSNEIGDKGLAAIAEYLENNTDLRELFLQNVSKDVHCYKYTSR